ncbi:MAG: hypothetical protein OXN15_09780 [Chloroflexota bacterium]|nr:hypothetical protein [Chloroflexota bacterium]
MVWRRLALPVVLALSLVLVACGGSGDEPAADEAPAAPSTSQADQDEPAPAQPTSADAAASDADSSSDLVDMVEHLRQKTFDLWEVYNTYDADALKAFYSDDYWSEKEEEVRSNMQPFKLFGVTISAEETSPPMEIEPGKWETRHTASFPLGSLKMVFIYEDFDGEWLLTYAEDQ